MRELRLRLAVDNVFDNFYLGQGDTPGFFESFYYLGALRPRLATLTLEV